MRHIQTQAFRLLPALLLATMLAVAIVMELTVLDPPDGLLMAWLPKTPLAALLVWPWLRRRPRG